MSKLDDANARILQLGMCNLTQTVGLGSLPCPTEVERLSSQGRTSYVPSANGADLVGRSEIRSAWS